MRFEWDTRKAELNKKNHGVDFEEAKSVFADENGRLLYDSKHSEHEDRFILLGLSALMRLLVVVHVERREDVFRIISARKATKSEAAQYRRFKK
ncbi:MAG: BrnT family toxin [Planctomycetota bacterium]|jgi:uncharacterized DUF497 family protein